MDLISRGDFLRSSVYSLAYAFLQGIRPVLVAGDAQPDAIHNFSDSTFIDISPNGKRIILWNGIRSPLWVVEMGSWRTIYQEHFQTDAYNAHFFDDSLAMVRTLVNLENNGIGVQVTAVNIDTGKRTDKIFKLDSPYSTNFAFTVRNGILLYLNSGNNGVESLTLVEFPEMRELFKVPYALQAREPRRRSGNAILSNDYGMELSDNRKIFAYSYDHTLVCRSLVDLSLLWTRQIEPDVIAWKTAVSANGNVVAVAKADTNFPFPQRRYGISVYDGKTGTDIATLPYSGTEGMALSPEGKLIAFVDHPQIHEGKSTYDIPTVQLYEINSGKRLASIIHDRIKVNNAILSTRGCKVYFTSDGMYLITSGNSTKIWKR
jgi:WD40 repeat protein